MRIRALLTAVLLAFPLLGAFAPAASALPTPGLFCDLSEPVTGRLFPEAMNTNDFVSYDEARCGLAKLEAAYPDLVTVEVIGPSAGWTNVLTGAREPHDVFAVHVTNAKSAIPLENKIRILFMLSIHGNEKGGREGGLRVIEDLANPAVSQMAPELVKMLDYMELLFLFPNPDGWTHEEAEYRPNDACYVSLTCESDSDANTPGAETQNFVRVNANGVDLNREAPTTGWYFEPYTAMSEPESVAYFNWMRNLTNVKYASDIHGMLNPADGVNPADGCLAAESPAEGVASGACPTVDTRGHFVLTMLPAGRMTPQELVLTTSLAENVKKALNEDPMFAEWHAIPESLGVWGGEFNEWGTVWDTIGYTDSGFTSDFFAQDGGLNAPGIDFELAYNHITFDNYYPGLAQRVNAYHIQTVRVIVKTFMEAADRDLKIALEQNGVTTAYLVNPKIVSNKATPENLTGWAAENPADDAFDLQGRPYEATPNDYFVDLKPFLKNGDAPGVLDGLTPVDLTPGRLASYKALVIGGSAVEQVEGNEAALAAIRAFTEAGGTLLLTDSATKLLVPLGIAESVDVDYLYAGHTNFLVGDDHPMVADVRGLARQTYEPVPLGYQAQGTGQLQGDAPSWFVAASGFNGEAIGFAPLTKPEQINVGAAKLGEGKVVFIGALLPDPTTEFYHPYGLESHAATYTGNQLLRNALGWTLTYDTIPVAPEALGKASTAPGGAEDGGAGDNAGTGVPAPGLVAVVAVALAGAAFLRRRA